ncbi:MAG TPA: CPBP family glutamic-type intramembrane protease [Pseudonocardiaceae bacterium]
MPPQSTPPPGWAANSPASAPGSGAPPAWPAQDGHSPHTGWGQQTGWGPPAGQGQQAGWGTHTGWGPPAGWAPPAGWGPPAGQGQQAGSGPQTGWGQPPNHHRYPHAPYPPYQPPAPEQPTKQRRPPHRWGFGAFLLAEATFLVTSLLVPVVAMFPYVLRDRGVAPDRTALPGPVLISALAVPPLLAAAVALVATKIRGNGPVVDLRLKFGWRDVGIGAACGFGGLLPTLLLGWLWVYVVGEDNATSAVGEVFDGLHLPAALAVLVFLDVWLVAPICEEILYRGLLWGAMERREWNRWLILGVTSVVFALAHFEPIRAPLLLVIGLPIGLARLLSGRLAAPIIAHQINNFLPALGLLLLLLGHPILA